MVLKQNFKFLNDFYEKKRNTQIKNLLVKKVTRHKKLKFTFCKYFFPIFILAL